MSLSSETAAALLPGTLMKAVLLLCTAWGITFCARRRSASLRHQIWLVALVACLALPFLAPALPAWHSKILSSAVAQADAVAPFFPQRPGGEAFVVHAVSRAGSALPWLPILFFVWAAGFAFLIAKLAIGFMRMALVGYSSKPLLGDDWSRELASAAKNLGIARSVRLLESADPKAIPLTWGIFQPKILVPSSAREWTAGRRRIVLLHELGHVARHDCAAQIVGEMVRALHWFNPLAWLALARLHYESECACDDLVLSSGIDAPAYAGDLLALARILDHRTDAWQPALAMARSARLERRLTAMLNPIADRRSASRKFRLLTSFAACCLLLPLAAFRLPAQNASGTVAGVIYDSSGAPAANATVIMIDLATNLRDMTVSDANGRFQLEGLPPGKYGFEVMKEGFATYEIPAVTMEPDHGLALNAILQAGHPQEPIAARKSIPVNGAIEQTSLFTRMLPVYPKSAKAAGVQGDVTLDAVIAKDGTPLSLLVKNTDANPELARAAVEAVDHWRYRPTLLNGEPISITTQIDVTFHLYP